MQGQGNFGIQYGQDPYARPPAFQQHPATGAPPATSHYGPLAPQPHVIQHARPPFHPRPDAVAYQHAMTNVPHQGRPAAAASGGMSSAQSYLHHPRPPQISNQITHSYPIIEQQHLPWSQNVHQLPPPAPLHGQIAYQLPSSKQTLERELSRQHPSHAPQSLPPPYTSSSTVMMSVPGGSSTIPVRELSYGQSIAQVLPPPPPPPLPPSPPRVPPLPPSSPTSDIPSKKDRDLSLKGIPGGDNLVLECPPLGKPVDDSSVGLVVADAAHSLTDSDMDMDMEDDITYPAEEKNNFFSVNSNDACGSMSQEDRTGEVLQLLQHTGGHRLPEVSVHGSLALSEASAAKAKGEGSEVASESGMTGCGENGNSFNASIKESPFRHENLCQSGELVVHAAAGCGELPYQLMESANTIKIIPDYPSNSHSENEDENLGDVSLPSLNDVSTRSDAEKGCDLGSDLTHKSLSESNMHLLPESLTVPPRNMMSADKLAIPAGMVEESSDRRPRGQEPDSSGTCMPLHSKDSSSNYDENIGLEEANAHKPDLKSDNLKVDEFGRLVREDVIDSDTSDSPSYARRHARRSRKRSRSQSRSRSPHDRRRRRSPWRRKERRDHSRSLSPRGRSRSRSPVLRRDTEFGGDKLRREKGQLPECFDFLQGKCYRGTNCRYSHKSERSRYNRGKQHHRDAPPTLWSPDIHKDGKVPTEKKNKDKGRRLSQERHGLREVNDEKGLPVGSTSQSPDKIGNHSGYAVHETPMGKYNHLIPETAAKYYDNIPQVVDQQGKRTDDILLSASASLAPALGNHPADKPDSKQDPTSQLYSVESYSTKPYSNQEVPSQSLKELLPSIANHPSPLSIPLPSASQLVSASFAQSVLKDCSSHPPISQNRLTPENYSTYETSVAYQHSHFPGPLKSLSSSFLPPPPPPPPASVEHSIPQHLEKSLLPPRSGLSSYTSMRNQLTEMPNLSQTGKYQTYSFVREPDQMLHRTDGFGSSSLHASNLTRGEGIPYMMGEDHFSGDPVQGSNSSKSFSRVQTNPLLSQSPLKGTFSSFGLGLSPDSASTRGRSYFQQASYGLQYSAGGHVHAKFSEPGLVGSSASRITQDFLERNRPYLHGFVGSKISNYFNPYASTFDLPLSSKLSSNTLVGENDATTNHGTPVGSSSVSVDLHRMGGAGSKNLISSSSVLPADCVSRPDGNQYDPLFDSIEPTSNSFSKADHIKHEITGDSDDLLRFHESGWPLNAEAVKQEGETTVSSDDSLEKEECGETADVAVGAVLNRSPSDPNDVVDMNAGEFEIDQVKTSGKKKKSKERSMKHFKISIAAFVKEVLKPSWRQGNMSKEAFKTIVKKTVDKVSGAMKSHQIPKSQAKINHYIDSSRGKLTKLVMGYVDKYVKV